MGYDFLFPNTNINYKSLTIPLKFPLNPSLSKQLYLIFGFILWVVSYKLRIIQNRIPCNINRIPSTINKLENVAPNIGPPTVDTPLLNRLLKVFGYAIALIIGLFLLLYFLLQIEFVQNVVLKTTTRYVSKELKTTVTFDHISVDFFDKLVLENFYAADFHGDTLLYSEALTCLLYTSDAADE